MLPLASALVRTRCFEPHLTRSGTSALQLMLWAFVSGDDAVVEQRGAAVA